MRGYFAFLGYVSGSLRRQLTIVFFFVIRSPWHFTQHHEVSGHYLTQSWEGDDLATLSSFSRMTEKKVALHNAVFGMLFHTSCTQSLTKINPRSSQASSHVRSRVPPLQYICDCAMTTAFQGPIWNFQKLVKKSWPAKLIARTFYFGGLRLCQCCDLTIISQRECVQMSFIAKYYLDYAS